MQNKELFGRNIKPGDIVISSTDRNTVCFGIITKITPKGLRIFYKSSQGWDFYCKNYQLKKFDGYLSYNCYLIQDESKVFSKEELEVINMLRKDL